MPESRSGLPNWREPRGNISVVDPKLFFSDPDPTFQEIPDPDPAPDPDPISDQISDPT